MMALGVALTIVIACAIVVFWLAIRELWQQ